MEAQEVAFEITSERNSFIACVYARRLETTKSGLLVSRASHDGTDRTTICAVQITPTEPSTGEKTRSGLFIPGTVELASYGRRDVEQVVKVSDSTGCAQIFQRLIEQSINNISVHRLFVRDYVNLDYRPYGHELGELQKVIDLITERYNGNTVNHLTEGSSLNPHAERFPGNYM